MFITPANSWLVRIGLCMVLYVGTWLGATWLVAFGLWVLVIGDREPSLWMVAPTFSGIVAATAAALYVRLSAIRPWQTALLFAIGTVTSVLAGWCIIVFVDEVM